MKTSSFISLVGVTLLALPQIASATLLVGFYSGSAGSKDTGLAGFSGSLSGSGALSGWNSTDGTFGPTLTGAPTGTGLSYGFGGSGPRSISMAVTNSTGSAYTLSNLLFDFTNDSGYPTTYAVSYSVTGGPSNVPLIGTTPNTGTTQAVNNLLWTDVASALIGITLNNLQTITFQFDTSNGGALDNIALTGLSAIPEPASLVALGCLMGSGMVLRQRRRAAACPV